MKYSVDPIEHADIMRWSFLSAFTQRTDAEEEGAQELFAKYGEQTGWVLLPREPFKK